MGWVLRFTIGLSLLIASGTSLASETMTEKSPEPVAGVQGAASPEEAFAAFQSAAQKGKLSEGLHVVLPADRPSLALTVNLAATMLASFASNDPAVAKEHEQLLAKHQVQLGFGGGMHGLSAMSDEQISAQATESFKNTDIAAFLVDIEAFLDRHMERPIGDGEPPPLNDLAISGDQATANFTSAKLGTQPVEFRRVDERWYIRSKLK